MTSSPPEPERSPAPSAHTSRWRRRLGDAAKSFSINIASRNLRRAQLSFAAAWTGEWTLARAISVVAFGDEGAERPSVAPETADVPVQDP
jgi:hypothetical protein